MSLTRTDFTRAKAMFDLGWDYRMIAKRLRRSWFDVRDALERRRPLVMRYPRRRRKVAIENDGIAIGWRACGLANDHHDKEIPASVIEERDRVFASNFTIEQTLLGDPLPGRSALDRMQAA